MSDAAVKGLKGVIAADSSICRVNGELGKLLYRGYNIDQLAEESTFEEVAYLLLKGELPSRSELESFQTELVASRKIPTHVRDYIISAPKTAHPMSVLRTAISLVGTKDPDAETHSPEAFFDESIQMMSQISTIIAAIKRCREGKEIVEPRDDLGHSANFMFMINGKVPTEQETDSMDKILIVHAEHGLNASTFSARVICATLTDLYSAITGAIGALKGPLHGGANTAVLNTLQEIGSVEGISAWVKEVRATKGKFMGFGHAVYQTEDPRAKHLKKLAGTLAEQSGDPLLYEMSVEIEKQVVAEIKRDCNVDFYSASLQYYMGIPGDLFTCIFAASRISGWCAHVIEQITDNKIIRPKANYVGADERDYTPIENR